MLKNRLVFGCIAIVAVLFATNSAEARITDAAGDFLSTYAGAQGGDLDVISSDVFFDGTNFTLTTTLNGLVGTTPNAIYVWGFDRGQGTARFNVAPFAPTIDLSQVLFDSVVILRPDTTVTVNGLAGNGLGATNLAAGTATISGNTIRATVAANLLPSNGFSPSTYTWNLWPRINGGTATNISDFAPDNRNQPVTVVPEVGSVLLFIPALFAGLGIVAIRRRNGKAA